MGCRAETTPAKCSKEKSFRRPDHCRRQDTARLSGRAASSVHLFGLCLQTAAGPPGEFLRIAPRRMPDRVFGCHAAPSVPGPLISRRITPSTRSRHSTSTTPCVGPISSPAWARKTKDQTNHSASVTRRFASTSAANCAFVIAMLLMRKYPIRFSGSGLRRRQE